MGRSSRGSSDERRTSVHLAAVDLKQAEPLQARATFDLLQKQSNAGFAMKELGSRLKNTEFEATALDGAARAVYDGAQELLKVEVKPGALAAASDDPKQLAAALLKMLQEGHASSIEGTRKDVWGLYKENSELLQAPLTQIGVGNTMEDAWANVTATDETLRMTEELFNRFDADKDGYWNLEETKQVQKATEGTEMVEDAFKALIIAAAPDGGRKLSEEDMARGLSKEQVIELYTNAARQKQLGFVLNIQKDYEVVFNSPKEVEPAATAAPVEVD